MKKSLRLCTKVINFNYFTTKIRGFVFLFSSVVISSNLSCIQSSAPRATDLVVLRAPTFSGQSNTQINAPANPYALNGECDASLDLHEYSYDNSTWTTFTCTADTFSLSVPVTNYKFVYARSKQKNRYSKTSTARVRFLRPATDPGLTVVSSSRSDESDTIGVGTQNTLSNFNSGNSISKPGYKINPHMPGVIYAQ